MNISFMPHPPPKMPNSEHRLTQSLGSNTLLSTQQENLAIRIFLVIHIIRCKEARTRDCLLDRSLEQLAEQVEYLAIAHHPFRLLIHIIKLPVLLKLNQMVKIRSHKNTLLQILQEFLTSDVLNIYIKHFYCFHRVKFNFQS